MSNINLNKLRDRAYQCACDHGFHDTELSNDHFIMLVITELSEAVEADRKNKRSNYTCFKAAVNFQSVTTDKMWKDALEEYIKDTVEDELADAVIRLLDLYGLREIDLDEDAFDDDTIRIYADTYRGKSFTESVYSIVEQLAGGRYSIKKSALLPEMFLLKILGFAKHINIDLFWHIEQKMKYNELREQRHGKKY